jgi:septum site-determining protein MinC
MRTPLAMKGIGNGVLVTVPPGEWDEVRPMLLRAIDERVDFFKGARMVIEVGERELSCNELRALSNKLSERDIKLKGVLSEAVVTREAVEELGLSTDLLQNQRGNPDQAGRKPEVAPPELQNEDEEEYSIETDLIGDEAILLHRTLRSGYSIRHPGHVTIIGDVNPGAEIVAGGNVIVWGRLRGVVHAGATGDEKAVVCALDLSPTQLRIAGQIAVSPERGGKSNPEMAAIRDGQLIAQTWKTERKR